MKSFALEVGTLVLKLKEPAAFLCGVSGWGSLVRKDGETIEKGDQRWSWGLESWMLSSLVEVAVVVQNVPIPKLFNKLQAWTCAAQAVIQGTHISTRASFF